MLAQGLKIGLALALGGALFVMFNAVDSGLGEKSKHERARDLILLAESPEAPQRAIVIVHSSKIINGQLTVELELRNNSDATLAGNVWGQALFGAAAGPAIRLVESTSRQTYKARVKTFKTLHFVLPADAATPLTHVEVFVSDDSTGFVTKYGEPAPKPAA